MKSLINITVCMGSACFARGNDNNLAFIEDYIRQNSLNAEIELIGSRCEGKCADGPNIIVNGTEYKKVNEQIIKEILDNYL